MPTNMVPVIGFTPAAEYEKQKAEEAKNAALALSAGAPASNLLSYMQKCLTDATSAKQISGVTDRLLDAQRRRLGVHSPEKTAQLAKYQLPNYWVPLTQTKCIHTEAWMRDLLMPYADTIWKLIPSPIPDLPEEFQRMIEDSVKNEAAQAMLSGEMISDMQMHDVIAKVTEATRKAVMEEAKDRALGMERLIQDQHIECNFTSVFREFQSNLATYGTAFLKGPFTVHKKVAKWSGKDRIVEDIVIPTCSAPSPHDMFPAPWATGVNDGWIIERIKTYREGLNAMRKLPYYNRANIEALLRSAGPQSTNTQYGDDRRFAGEDKQQAIPDDRYELFQFNGPVTGYMLAEWGITVDDPGEDYNMEVLWSKNYILKVMPRWDEIRTTPYFKAVFKPVVGSFWGVGVPHLMSASQDRANAMMIAMLDNTVWASGPIGWLDVSRLVNPNDAKNIHPHKMLAVHTNPGETSDPIKYLTIDMKIGELMAQYRECLTDADNESGVPSYAYGGAGGGGAASTYSGLQTLMNSAAKGIKDALLQVDMALTSFVEAWADWDNEYSDDDSIKGDIQVQCSGATGLFVAEMRLAKYDEMMEQVIPMIPLVGPRFAVDILRAKAKELNLDYTLLPDDETLRNQIEIATQATEVQQQAPEEKPGAEQNPETKPLPPLNPVAG